MECNEMKSIVNEWSWLLDGMKLWPPTPAEKFSSIKQKKTSQWNSAMEVKDSLEWMNEWAACFVLLVGYGRRPSCSGTTSFQTIFELFSIPATSLHPPSTTRFTRKVKLREPTTMCFMNESIMKHFHYYLIHERNKAYDYWSENLKKVSNWWR